MEGSGLADLGTASRTFSNAITVISPSEQETTTGTTTIQYSPTNLTFDIKYLLGKLLEKIPGLSDLQDVIGTTNTLISLVVGLFTLYGVTKSMKKERRSDRRKRR